MFEGSCLQDTRYYAERIYQHNGNLYTEDFQWGLEILYFAATRYGNRFHKSKINLSPSVQFHGI